LFRRQCKERFSRELSDKPLRRPTNAIDLIAQRGISLQRSFDLTPFPLVEFADGISSEPRIIG
jgi:hypothetical protein